MFKHNKAFTIIELMVVIVILGTVSYLPLNNINSLTEHILLRSEVKKLVSYLLQTRHWAVNNHQISGIRFNKSNQKYEIFTDTISKKNYQLPPEITLKEVNLSFGNQAVEFQPTGTCLGGNIILSNQQGQSYQITIYGTTGRVRWESYD